MEQWCALTGLYALHLRQNRRVSAGSDDPFPPPPAASTSDAGGWTNKKTGSQNKKRRDIRVEAHLRCFARNFVPGQFIINQQLEARLLTVFFRPGHFRNSALAQNFSNDPKLGKADMGSLVHSRQSGKRGTSFRALLGMGRRL